MNLRLTVSTSSLALVCAGLALAACHGTPESETKPAEKSATAPAAPGAGEDHEESGWDAMTKEQHEKIMREQVLPTMKPAFAAFDPKEFGAIKCGTCHGDGAKDKTYTMPNPKLPKLPTDAEGWKKLEADEAEAVKFMRETVVPKMAAIIGEPPYDPKTGEGFGCFECHTKKQ